MEKERIRDNITLEAAIARICREIFPVSDTEQVGLTDAVGRILANDMYAPIDHPPFDRSPVDGYALKAADTLGASEEHPAVLRVIAQVDAGGYFSGAVGAGQAVRIMTGAPVPKGCDVCVRQEDTDYGEDFVRIYVPYRSGVNYCYAGEDFKEGQRLLSAGTKLGYVEISVLASMGADKVCVYRRPKISLLTTGDELVFPGRPLLPGQIYNSNLFGLAARLTELGLCAALIKQLPDDGSGAAAAVSEAAKVSDLILTTGGVSVGKKDILHDVQKLLPMRRLFWGIQMKPGMPAMASVLENTVVISLTGNPFGALATFELLVRPALAKLCRDDTLPGRRRQAVFCGTFPKASPVRRFIRAIYTQDRTEGICKGTAGSVCLPDGSHSSGVLASMRGCNCLIDIPGGSPGLKDQALVDILLL